MALCNMLSSLSYTGSGIQMVWSVLGHAVLALGESGSVCKKSLLNLPILTFNLALIDSSALRRTVLAEQS